MELQLRSAISHINEVWAVEAAGAGLHAFSQELGWEFTLRRLAGAMTKPAMPAWGGIGCSAGALRPPRYRSDVTSTTADPHGALYLLAMLAYFETKNIGKKINAPVLLPIPKFYQPTRYGI